MLENRSFLLKLREFGYDNLLFIISFPLIGPNAKKAENNALALRLLLKLLLNSRLAVKMHSAVINNLKTCVPNYYDF